MENSGRSELKISTIYVNEPQSLHGAPTTLLLIDSNSKRFEKALAVAVVIREMAPTECLKDRINEGIHESRDE